MNAAPRFFSERVLWSIVGAAGMLIFADRFVFYDYYDVEMAVHGNLARALVEGLAAPAGFYQYGDHSHGSLIFGLLLAPLFRIGGSALIWTKLLSAILVVGGVSFWTIAIRRACGLAPALFFAALFIVPPPRLEFWLHTSYAIHMESIFFSGLLGLLFTRRNAFPLDLWPAVAAGLIAGFATAFAYENVVVFGALACAAFVRFEDKKVFVVRFLPAILAFLIGFSPHWLVRYPLSSPFSLGPPDAAKTWFTDRYYSLFVILFHRAAGYSHVALTRSFFLLAVAGFALVGYRAIASVEYRRSKAGFLGCFLALYGALFLAVYGISPFYMAPIRGSDEFFCIQYLTIIFPFLVAAIAQLIAFIPRLAAACLAAAFLFAGAADMWHSRPATPRGAGAATNSLLFRGDDYDYLIEKLPELWGGDADCALSSVLRLPRSWRCDGLAALARTLDKSAVDKYVNQAGNPTDAACLINGFGAREAKVFSAGPDPIWRARLDEQFREALAQYRQTDPKQAANFVEGLGFGLLGPPQGNEGTDFVKWLAAGSDDLSAAPKTKAAAAAVREAFAFFQGASDADAMRAALFHGLGRWLGCPHAAMYIAREIGPDDRYPFDDFRRWVNRGRPDDFSADEEAAYSRGAAAGLAHRIKSRYRAFVLRRPFERLAAVAEELAKDGLLLQKTADRPEKYAVVEAP
jgi:hypothetical protein